VKKADVTLYTGIVQTLAALALLGTGAAVGLLVAQASPAGRAWLRERLSDQELHPIAWAWLVALMAMLGSLYFSDVVGFIPCLLCWYQRIAMYPIVFVLGVGLLQRDPTAWRFALPLPLVGLVISLYHVAVQYQPSLEIVACVSGVSCSTRYVAVFGFVSIPVMAAAAFLMIAVLLFTVRTVQLGSTSGSPPVESSDVL
jgi:disulfide bond formation protein DsbB